MLPPADASRHARSRCRARLAVTTLAALALGAPAAGRAAPPQQAFVPADLASAAAAAPHDRFRVIVQGTSGRGSEGVAADVRAEVATQPDRVHGLGRSFRSISGVSAELSGRQILHLASRRGIRAITRDAPLAAGADLAPIATVDPVGDVTPVALDEPLANTTAPSIAGTAEQDAALTGDAGAWTGVAPLSFSYRWQRCGVDGGACAEIPNAADATYVPVVADIGATLRLEVTATDATGAAATAVSDPSARVLPQPVDGFWSRELWPYTLGAEALWSKAAAPPTIAVVDSGIDTSVGGLDGAVTAQVSLTTLAQADAPDGYGHGTFVAQVAAGRADGYAGVAPRAHLVSLDVMDDNGRAMTSDVIAAADWIYEHEAEYGIRVANFSLVGSSPASVQFDPVDRAVEKLWLSGVVVVAAAGNYAVDGAESGVAYAPANDPFVIAVGANDVNGSVAAGDDFAAPWSAWGYDPDGFARPDVGAPGRSLVEAVPTGSTIYQTRTDRIVAPGYVQLSGTSFAAPAVAGVAAQLLALHPDWTPDEVKGALMASAADLPAATHGSSGLGEVDAAAAAALDAPPNPNAALEKFVVADPDGGPTPVFDGSAWQAAAAADPLWGAESWGTESWGTESWGTESWGTSYWQTSAWATESWGTESWGTESWGTSAPADGASDDALDPAPGWIAPS